MSTGWLDPSVDHCDWHGVECNDASGGKIVKLELPSNGLTETLTPRIADLRHLEVLDVTDNDVKVRRSGLSTLRCLAMFIGFSLNECIHRISLYRFPFFFVSTVRARFRQRLPCSPISPVSN